MINSTNNDLKVQAVNSTFDTALQYASTAAKAICLLTAGIVIGKYFGSAPQSPFTGNSALANLDILDTHVFTSQNGLITPANFSTSIQPTSFLLPEKIQNFPLQPQSPKNSSTASSITFVPLLPKIFSAATKASFTPLLIKAPSLPQSLKNASITASIISKPAMPLAISSTDANITTFQSLFAKNMAEEIQVKNESPSATNLTLYQEFPLGKTIQKTALQNPILNQSVETPVITNLPENALDECSEEICEYVCDDELPLNSNSTAINITEDEAQCTVVAESMRNKIMNLSCNIASKAFNASCKVGKAVGKGLYNYLSANCYRRVRLFTAMGAAYRCDPRVRAGLTRIYRNARS